MNNPSKSLIKGRFTLILRGAVAAGLLILLFQLVSLKEVAVTLQRARLDYLGGALALVAANLGIQISKWRYFVRLIAPSSTTRETAASVLFGITLGTITPGQLGEFGGRALRHSTIPAGSIIGLTLVDRLQMLCVMGIAGLTCIMYLLKTTALLKMLVLPPGIALLVFLFFRPKSLLSLIPVLPRKLAAKPWMNDLAHALGLFRARDIFISLLFSIAFYGIVSIQMFLLLNAFSQVSITDSFLGFASMMFVKALLPISLGDLGLREAGSVYFYSLLGIESATAVSASLLLFVINIALPSLVGIIFTPRLGSR